MKHIKVENFFQPPRLFPNCFQSVFAKISTTWRLFVHWFSGIYVKFYCISWFERSKVLTISSNFSVPFRHLSSLAFYFFTKSSFRWFRFARCMHSIAGIYRSKRRKNGEKRNPEDYSRSTKYILYIKKKREKIFEDYTSNPNFSDLLPIFNMIKRFWRQFWNEKKTLTLKCKKTLRKKSFWKLTNHFTPTLKKNLVAWGGLFGSNPNPFQPSSGM